MELQPLVPLPASLASRIPQDVFDQILSHMNSTAAFKRCSLVCHAWLLTCRLYLFSEVLLSPSFLRFLRGNAHTTVTNSIRHAVICSSWDDSTEHDLCQLVGLLPKLSRLRELTLKRYCKPWHLIDNIAPLSEVSFPENITSINLRDLRFPSLAKLQECVIAFAGLQTLSIDGVAWDNTDSIHSSSSMKFKLDDVKIRRCNGAAAILDWLSDITRDNHPYPLQSLLVCNLNASEAPSLARFVRKHGTLLQHLTLGFQGCDANVDEQESSFGSACPNLKSFSIDPLSLYRFPPAQEHDRTVPSLSNVQSLVQDNPERRRTPSQASSAWYTTLLSTMTSSPLSHLTFTLWFSAEFQLDQMDWGTLNAFLQSSPPLEIRFVIWGLGTAGTESFHLARSWFQRRLWALRSGTSLSVVLDRQTFGYDIMDKRC